MIFKPANFALAIFLFTFAGLTQFACADDRGPVKSLLEMRRKNVVVQEWDLSCGAAALATLLHYQHGDFVSEREIAKGLISRKEYIQAPILVKIRFGFSLLDLKRYVDARGYEGTGYGKLEIENLLAKAPIMVPIHTKGYNHFVIFLGMFRNRVLLADPAWGNRTMPVHQFEESWINYPKLGKIGFVVSNPNNTDQPDSTNKLSPEPDDFVTFL